MNQHYQPIYQQARNLEFKVRDILDKPDHPSAQNLRSEVKQLIEDIEVDKKPRSLEDRVKAIQRKLMDAKNQGHEIMNPEHSDMLHNLYERLRVDLRRFPNY